MYLTQDERAAATAFMASPVWQAIKLAMKDRSPPHSEAGEATETASQRAFERKGFEKYETEIEKLSREEPVVVEGPIPESILDPRD